MLRNLCKETANNPGNGTTISLAGAPSGYLSFLSSFGNGGLAWYALTDGTQTEIQAGIVTAGSPNTLARGTPIWTSTGSAARLTFTGSVSVYCVQPADRTLYADNAGVFQAAAKRIAGVGTATAATDAATLLQVGWQQIGASVNAGATTVVAYTLPATYTRYRVEFAGAAAAAGQGFARFSNDGGSTFRSGASDYGFAAASIRAAGVSNSGATQTYIPLTDTPGIGGGVFGSIEVDTGLNLGFMDGWVTTSGLLARLSGLYNLGFTGVTTIQVGIAGSSFTGVRARLLGGF